MQVVKHGPDVVVLGTDQIMLAARFADISDTSAWQWGGSFEARAVLHHDGTVSLTQSRSRGRDAVVFTNVRQRGEA